MDNAPAQRSGNMSLGLRIARMGGWLWRALVRSNIVWPVLAILALLWAIRGPWLSVPLIVTRRADTIPVDIGWGFHSDRFNFGSLCLLVALVITVRTLLAVRIRLGRFSLGPWPLNTRTLVVMSGLCLGIFGLFLFQFTMVDFHMVATLTDQENQNLLIQNHLGYPLPTPLIPTNDFAFSIDSWQDRFQLFAQLLNPGALLPLLADFFCAYGAFLAWRRQGISVRNWVRGHLNAPVISWRRALWLALGVIVLVLLARAPAGLFYESRAEEALSRGSYTEALDNFRQAHKLLPTLDYLPRFHQQRGETFYVLGRTSNLDIGLYLTWQYRSLGQYNNAWSEEQTLYTVYPHDQALLYDMTVTLELLSEQNFNNVLAPADNEATAQQPQVVSNQLAALALPWLDRLTQYAPDNVYGHYLRGRLLYSQASYENAQHEFLATISLTRDAQMQSEAYTYLSFCDAGLGNYDQARTYLIQAENLDYGYFNTTAREAASGLH